jgi:hypothetical protein
MTVIVGSSSRLRVLPTADADRIPVASRPVTAYRY